MLTDMMLRQAKATGKSYTIADFDGLSLFVSANGTKLWHFRYTWVGQRARISLGSPELSLRDARDLRDEARALLAKGINPRVDRKQKYQAMKLAGENTFMAVYEKWLEHRQLTLEEGRQSSLDQIRRTFNNDVFPYLKRLTVYEITRPLLLEVIGRSKSVTRCLSRKNCVLGSNSCSTTPWSLSRPWKTTRPPTCMWWPSRCRRSITTRSGLLSRIGSWAGFLSQNEVNDSVIRAVVSPRQQKMNQGAVYADYGGQIDKSLPNIVTRGAADVGLTMGSLGFFSAMDVLRQALPMVLSLLKMALVICIPLVLLVGTYELKAVVTVSVVEFSLFFVDFWFQLARWLDSTILDALYGWGFGADRPHTNFDPLIGLNNTFGDMLLNFVMATMFIVLPTFWVAALGWAVLATKVQE
jgi:hypothetical protein